MQNLRNSLKKNFTIVPNALVLDQSLSDRARFLYVLLAVKPDEWKFLHRALAKELGYSVETLRKYMEELIQSGWVVRTPQGKDERGRFTTYEYELLSQKNTVPAKTRYGKTPTRPTITKKEVLTKINRENNTSATARKSGKTFPKDWYNQVTESYKRIKGVEPQGREWLPIQKTIKLMFQDGRTPEQICALMEALERSPLEWTRNWTMNTVRRKMAEYLAGKLDLTGRKRPALALSGRDESYWEEM